MKTCKIRIALYLNYFIFALLLNSVGILIQRSINLYGVDEVSAGSLEAFKDLSIALVSIAAGSFLLRLGYKKAMLLSLTMVFMVCLLMYFNPSFTAVKIFFACVGTSFAFIKISIYSLVGLLTRNEKEHSSFLSTLESFFMVGIATAFLGFPLFYSDTDPDAWLNIYLAIALLVALSFSILLSVDFSVLPQAVPDTGPQDALRQMFLLLRRPVILVFALTAFLYVMTEQGIMNWLPTFNEQILHLSEPMAVHMAAILTLSFAAGRYVSAFLVKKLNWFILLMICLTGATLMVILLLPLTDNIVVKDVNSLSDVPMVAYVFPFIGFFLAPLYPLVNSVVLSSTEKVYHSPMAALLVFFSAVGGTGGSWVVGYLFQHLGGSKAFYFSLVPLALLMICLVFLYVSTYRSSQKKLLPVPRDHLS